jgi:carbamoyltransferase
MGLAPYGEPKYVERILGNLVDLKPDGSYRLNQDYFDYCTGLTMTNRRFDALFGQPARKAEEKLTQFHMDVAASIQAVTEEIVLRMTRALAEETGVRKLCLAGGVALNCVANGKVLRDGRFEGIWIQPASGDAGGAVGAALGVYHSDLGQPRVPVNGAGDGMAGSYLGPRYSQAEAERRLRAAGARFTALEDEALLEATVEALVAEKAVGWFQGRMEFGPRALGARSILGDPRSPSMQKTLNLRVKYRESFRPFCPSMPIECAPRYLTKSRSEPFMITSFDAVPGQRDGIPAVVHQDGTARPQTVSRTTNERYWKLLRRYGELTGHPVLLNTSMNVMGEPIVCNPREALKCFFDSGMDALVLGNYILTKNGA